MTTATPAQEGAGGIGSRTGIPTSSNRRRRLGRSSRNRAMVVRYQDDLRIFPSLPARVGLAALALFWAFGSQGLSSFWLNALTYAAIAAIAAIGLNLLTGYTGQVSLGHAFFLAVGAYATAHFGAEVGWSIFLWLPVAGVIGGVVGAIIGPFALRLRGNYLVIVTLGMLFLGEHIFKNWTDVTGGGNGISVAGALPTLDTSKFDFLGQRWDRNQGWFWLSWALVAVAALLAKNIVRTRPGRAMQAIRDRDLAAEVIGVSLTRYKIAAFAVSSAFAAVAGALYGSFQGFVQPSDFGLVLSIQYVAMIVIGGVGTIFGGILGAVVVGTLPFVIQELSSNYDLPLVSGDKGGLNGYIEIASLNKMLYGLLIVLFLIFEPHGLAAVWFRVKAWFRTWPFSY